MKKIWKNLINLLLIYKKKNKEARKNYRWSPPPLGWTKLNFDGASRGNLDIAGISCIINNALGKWIARRAKPLEPTTNNLVELEALREGLQIFLDLVLSKIIIEGDSKIVLNAVRKRSMLNLVLNSKLEEVLNILDRFPDTQICHIFWEGNQKDDPLANKGTKGEIF